MTFIKQLRDAGRSRPLGDRARDLLLSAADEVAGRVAALHKDVTQDNMVALNSAWGHAARLLTESSKPPPSGAGGAMEMQRAA